MNRLRPILFAFGVGALTAGAWAWLTKRELEAEFGSGARELERTLTASGSALRREIAALAADSAVAALHEKMRSFGITPGMLADLRTAIAAAEAVRVGARRAGLSVAAYLERLR